MKFIPDISTKEIKTNHKNFIERISLYKKRGLDFTRSREFILKKARPLRGNILEIGTGTGYTTLALAKANYKFISVDKDKEALKITALNLAYENVLHNVIFYIMDGEFLIFDDGSFSNLVVVNLFHHINNIDKMFSEVNRVLCPNGKAVLADFNKSGMEIVNSVHEEEGHIHEDSSVNKDYVYSYFQGLGYGIKEYDEKCHWLLIVKKLLQE